MKKITLLTAAVLSLCVFGFAQDLHFSQFYAAPLNANPGNTGAINADIRVYSLYRMQWFTVTNPYKTFNIAADGPISSTVIIRVKPKQRLKFDATNFLLLNITRTMKKIESIIFG